MFLILFHWKTLCKDENDCAFESTFLTILIISLFISMKQYNKKNLESIILVFLTGIYKYVSYIAQKS